MIARGAKSGKALAESVCRVNSLNSLERPTYLKGIGVGDTTSGWYLRTHLNTQDTNEPKGGSNMVKSGTCNDTQSSQITQRGDPLWIPDF